MVSTNLVSATIALVHHTQVMTPTTEEELSGEVVEVEEEEAHHLQGLDQSITLIVVQVPLVVPVVLVVLEEEEEEEEDLVEATSGQGQQQEA